MTTFIERVLGAKAGTAVKVVPDLVILNDGICYTAAEMTSGVKSPEKVRVIFDHDVPTGTPEASRVFGIIRKFAKENGLKFIQAKGVGYQYFLDTEIKPNQIVIQGGSHAAIYGSVGALGISVSGTELARVMENDSYSVVVPETVVVAVTGSLNHGVSIMDAAMTFLCENPCLAGKAIEFAAPGLNEHEKAVLCSMACETGAFTAAVTDASGADITLDLSAVVPMVTMPCVRRDVQKNAVRQPYALVQENKFHAGQIGGYTGGTIEDLRIAAELIRGKKLARGFRLSIAPATSTDFIKAMNEGIITEFINFGAQISAVGDHSVVSQGAGVIGKNEKLLTTGLYTFSGSMGVSDSEVYTASVETVIKASIA